jgi:hypothetical protein
MTDGVANPRSFSTNFTNPRHRSPPKKQKINSRVFTLLVCFYIIISEKEQAVFIARPACTSLGRIKKNLPQRTPQTRRGFTLRFLHPLRPSR